MGDAAGKWLVLMGYCAIIMVLVRRNSQGPGFVTAVGGAMKNVITASTGGGTF